MREFKFRVYNTETNKMINNVKEMGIFALKEIYSIDEFLVIPTDKKYPLMQYTGLKDKNGVEIYEGDICRCYGGIKEFGQYEYSGVYEVKYFGNGFDMVKDNCGYGWGLSGAIDIIEVIGNIYENPELLERS